MRAGHLEIPVADPARARAFYEEVLGFRHEQTQGDRYVWLSLGEAAILLNPDLPPPPPGAGAGLHLVLYTEDLPGTVARLAERGLRTERRGNCVFFADPDGNPWELVDPGEDHSGG